MDTGLSGLALAHELFDQRTGAVQPYPPCDEDVANPALVQQPEEQVLGADEAVSEADGLAQRQLQRLLGVPLERDVAAAPVAPRRARAVESARTEGLLGLAAHLLEVDAQRREPLRVERATAHEIGLDIGPV